MTLDLDNRIQLCPHCFHTQARGYHCERCGLGTMRASRQMAQVLKITAAHEEINRHGVAVPGMSVHRAQ